MKKASLLFVHGTDRASKALSELLQKRLESDYSVVRPSEDSNNGVVHPENEPTYAVVLALVSTTSNGLAYWRVNLRAANRKNVPILVLLVEPDARPPAFLRAAHAYNFSDPSQFEPPFQELLRAIVSAANQMLPAVAFTRTIVKAPRLLELLRPLLPDLVGLRQALYRESVDATTPITVFSNSSYAQLSTLALALCHEPNTADLYYDGILWVEVSGTASASVEASICRFFAAQGAATCDDKHPWVVESLLTDKAALIVLSDITAPLLPDSLLHAPASHLLVTTTQDDVADELCARFGANKVTATTNNLSYSIWWLGTGLFLSLCLLILVPIVNSAFGGLAAFISLFLIVAFILNPQLSVTFDPQDILKTALNSIRTRRIVRRGVFRPTGCIIGFSALGTALLILCLLLPFIQWEHYQSGIAAFKNHNLRIAQVELSNSLQFSSTAIFGNDYLLSRYTEPANMLTMATYFELGLLAEEPGQTGNAVDLFKKAIAINDCYVLVHWQLALAEITDKDYRSAYRHASAALNDLNANDTEHSDCQTLAPSSNDRIFLTYALTVAMARANVLRAKDEDNRTYSYIALDDLKNAQALVDNEEHKVLINAILKYSSTQAYYWIAKAHEYLQDLDSVSQCEAWAIAVSEFTLGGNQPAPTEEPWNDYYQESSSQLNHCDQDSTLNIPMKRRNPA